MKQFVIIGNSAAGLSAVEAIRSRDKDSKIIVLSDEEHPSYCRCLISYYLAGDVKKEKILYRPESFYKDNNIELVLNKKVTRVDPKKNRIVCQDKSAYDYDSLLIATGASPKFPDTKGIKKTGVFGFRTLKNTIDIDGLLAVTKSACVLGGGLVGLKAAYALKKRGVDVKVIVRSKQVLSQILDSEAAGLVQKRLQENGIEVVLGEGVSEIIGEEKEIKAVKLESGKAYAASLVIVGKGVSPNIDLVKNTDIKTGEGIISSSTLATNIENIYTAGDCTESFDLTLGKLAVNALWPVAVEQGRVAGSNMAGDQIKYDGSLGMNSLEFFGLPTVSLGIYKLGDSQGYEEIKSYDRGANVYKKVVLQNNLLVGAVLAGNINSSGVFLKLIRDRIDVSTFRDKLLEDNFGYPDIMEFVKDKERLYV